MGLDSWVRPRQQWLSEPDPCNGKTINAHLIAHDGAFSDMGGVPGPLIKKRTILSNGVLLDVFKDQRLEQIVNSKFIRISYTEAVEVRSEMRLDSNSTRENVLDDLIWFGVCGIEVQWTKSRIRKLFAWKGSVLFESENADVVTHRCVNYRLTHSH